MSEERKIEITEKMKVERRRLVKNLELLNDEDMVQPGVGGPDGKYSVKDILAHLVEWEQMFLEWYQAGLRGEVPEVPAPGITWRELRVLNAQIFEKHRKKPLEDIKAKFESSYKQVMEVVEVMSVEDFFERGRYNWMGPNENVGGYVKANTGNHYRWAKNKIRKWLKTQDRI
ncbi:MAG: ClbS/DfsB family four-helix bundle protein [Candidatus Hodarchaeales archaeon]